MVPQLADAMPQLRYEFLTAVVGNDSIPHATGKARANKKPDCPSPHAIVAEVSESVDGQS